MKIGICDDSVNDMKQIKETCTECLKNECENIEIITFSSAEEFLESDKIIDILILDIEMDGMSGIELKNYLQRKEIKTMIIFVTDHDELVLSAFGMNVFGFAMKKMINNQLLFIYRTLWGLVLIISLFDGAISKKIQMYVVSYFFITIIDISLWSILINIKDSNLTGNNDLTVSVCNSLGVLFWGITTVAIRKERLHIYNVLTNLSLKYYTILLSVLVGVSVIVGSIQYSLIDNIPESLKKICMLVGMVFSLIIIMGCIIFIYTLYMKKSIEYDYKMDKIFYEKQVEYYKKMLEKDEKTKKFRHDIRKHMRAIASLCEEGDIGNVKKYVENLQEDYQECCTIYTGNIISDSFISSLIENMKSDPKFKYSIRGKIPQKFDMNQNDFCVLIANALENVEHALKKVEGKKLFTIDIKNYNGYLFIKISNSALAGEMDNFYKRQKKGGVWCLQYEKGR